MSRRSVIQQLRPGRIAFVLIAVTTATAAFAHETHATVDDPGFRPATRQAAAFVESFDAAVVAVYPSIVRKTDRTAYSYGSRDQIVMSLNAARSGTAIALSRRIDMGVLRGRSQWEWFQGGIEAVSREINRKAPDADYSMVMEVLFAPGNKDIFSVHLYILDRDGENAFSFLMNSHHRSFVEANLVVKDSTEDARIRVIEKATRLGLVALQAQLGLARASAQ